MKKFSTLVLVISALNLAPFVHAGESTACQATSQRAAAPVRAAQQVVVQRVNGQCPTGSTPQAAPATGCVVSGQ